MTSLNIHELDERTYERLEIRAVQHGVSVEEEVCQILQQAVATPERLGDLFLSYFGPANGIALALRPRQSHEPIDLDQ